MRVAYADTSWLVEVRRGGDGSHLSVAASDVQAFITSELTRLELSRTLRRLDPTRDWSQEVSDAVSGVAAVRLTATVLDLAAALPVRYLRSLDAVHVASALLLDCDVVLTRDRQLARACTELGLAVA